LQVAGRKSHLQPSTSNLQPVATFRGAGFTTFPDLKQREQARTRLVVPGETTARTD